MNSKILYTLALLLFSATFSWGQDIIVLNEPLVVKTDFTVAAKEKVQLVSGFKIQPPQGVKVRFKIGDGNMWNSFLPKEGETTPIWVNEYQDSRNATGETAFHHVLIDSSEYQAVRIGEYLWMNMNLNDSIPMRWAQPWNPGTAWTGEGSYLAVTQKLLNEDMDRLFIDKSQYQIDMNDFHRYYGRYYTRWDIHHFRRVRGQGIGNEKNLVVYEGDHQVLTNWKVPFRTDFRQLFAMVPMPENGVLDQIAVRTALSYKKNENPLAYDIYDPSGGMTHRTAWFERSTNILKFNMMPGGSRVNGNTNISNGLGPNNGAWAVKAGDIYHLFHTAKYATADGQIAIHDTISTGIDGDSYHWYNVRFCRELSDAELGYRLFINKEDYEESYEYTIRDLDPNSVSIIKLGLDKKAPTGYYELPKGYLRGFYVNHILNKENPKKVRDIVRYLQKIIDDLFVGSEPENKEPQSRVLKKLESSVSIYPNPAESIINVVCEEEEVIRNVEIFNLAGFKILGFKNLNTYTNLDVSRLTQGVYVMAIETDRGRYSYRIFKK